MGWFGAKSNQSVGKSIKSTKSGKSAPTNASNALPKNAGGVKPKSPTRAKAREQQYQPPAGNNERKLRPPSQTQQTKHSEASRGAPNMIPAEKSSSSEEDEKSLMTPMVVDSGDVSEAVTQELSYDNAMEEGNIHHSHLNSLFNGHLMKWKFEAEEGTIFLRVPAFLGALSLIGCTIAAFIVDKENAYEIHSIVMYICITLMASLIIILDGRFIFPHPLSVRSHMRNIITRNFNILRFLWGRGLLYITAGVLIISQMWLCGIFAGSFMCAVGALAVPVGIHASRKFSALRNSLADESFLLLIFANYDGDGDGYVDPREFSMILMDLGVELDDRYTLKAFNIIDQEGNRRISFEEFSHWWSSGFVERGRKHWSEDDEESSYRRMG